MPITSWTPQNVLRPVVGGFKPAVFQVKAAAVALAPAPSGKGKRSTRGSIRVKFTGPLSARIDALARGPSIYPITSGSKAGTRVSTRGFFIPGGPGEKGDGKHVVREIDHPGSPPHRFLQQAVGLFPSLYAANTRKRMGSVLNFGGNSRAFR